MANKLIRVLTDSPDSLSSLFERSRALKVLLSEIREVASVIDAHDWAEANAGNLSVNIATEFKKLYQTDSDWFLVSRGGSRYRQLARDPLPHLLLVEIRNSSETRYPPDALPTSEWTCHRLLQQRFISERREERVVLHSHPREIIVLSHLDLFKDEASLNQALNRVLPETSLYLKAGIALSNYAPPGSEQLAQCSFDALGDRNALIWQHHGLLCCGKTLSEALDFMEIICKAAGIYLQLKQLEKIRSLR